MYKELNIHSFKGEYTVNFCNSISDLFFKLNLDDAHIIIDKKVFELFQNYFREFLKNKELLIIDATEQNKSLEKMPEYVGWLIKNNIRRKNKLIAFGGGIIQDITCFLSSTILRGVSWDFVPTTLLSQADSCIGSKSSINSNGIKNILGTFNPPNKIFISNDFLDTLSRSDIKSGIGEMLKVHAIDGPSSFKNIKNEYDQIFLDKNLMMIKIIKSLEIKKRYIEEDEFDKGPRNIFNYGHSFGHAIESATKFKIPHGIAISIGCDVANYTAMKLGITTSNYFQLSHPTFKKNYEEYINENIPINEFFSALFKDKKNKDNKTLSLVFPDINGKIFIDFYDNNKDLNNIIEDYFSNFKKKNF